jgi:hypothetical protein
MIESFRGEGMPNAAKVVPVIEQAQPPLWAAK